MPGGFGVMVREKACCQDWLGAREIVMAHDANRLMCFGGLRGQRCVEGEECEVVDVG
jgi:hypothetical protein